MKNVLLIAGSDSIGGAGVQADIKTCETLGCFSATALTCLVAENTSRVEDIMAVPPQFVLKQIECILEELEIGAVKIGMLFNADIMRAIAPVLKQIKAPIVLDPVCISKGGAPLIEPSAICELAKLLEFATIATPNRFEFKELLGERVDSLPCDLLVKKSIDGGATDVLYKKDGTSFEFSSPLLEPSLMHGTGCTLSSAIACFLAQGFDVQNAVKNAKDYVSGTIKTAINTHFGTKLLNHKARV